MSEIEDAILVDRMDDVEAEQAAKHTEDLLDFGDTPVTEREESPISSTTDQLLDFMKPDTTDVGSYEEDLKDTKAPTSYEGVQEIPPQEQVLTPSPPDTSSPENVEMEDRKESPPTDIPKKKELTSCMAKWLVENNVDRKVIDLIYWTCWKKSAAVFGGIMFILLSLTCYTFISVVTLFSIALLTVAFLYRIGMTVFNAVQKTTAEHPFKHLLDEDLEISEETVKKLAEKCRQCLNGKISKLQKLFLIEDAVESVKFGVMLWLLSYIGSWFSMLTLSIIACVHLFTIPMLYERNQEQVDKVLGTVKTKAQEIVSTIQAKMPEKLKFGKAKSE